MVNDPVGDFIIQLKNAGAIGKSEVVLPYSKLKHAIADKLVNQGYLTSAKMRGKKVRKSLEVALTYDADGTPKIQGVKRVSKPGRRVYVNVSDIHPVKYGKGKLVISTPEGILTGEEARQHNVGGEQLFKIW